ncbi:MAG: hypothetical protein ACJ0OB_02235 [Flavobacteriaceae bacterium]
MKKVFYLLFITLIISCSSDEEDIVQDTNPTEFTFKYNIHSSLPSEWTTEFYKIMKVLHEDLIPIKPNSYFYELPIYAWNSSVDKPYKDNIGDATGASISGNGASINGKFMVLEIPKEEFEFNAMHRFSVIAHEYYHVYQMSLSKNFFDGNIELKWMSEGSAATFESLYIQQHYSYNYFKDAQTSVDIAAINNPTIFETFSASQDKDINYSSSVFMFLVLCKELQKTGLTEIDAFELIMKEFWTKNPTNGNWKVKFREGFGFSVDEFYNNLKSYTNDINTVLPSEDLKLESIYKD